MRQYCLGVLLLFIPLAGAVGQEAEPVAPAQDEPQLEIDIDALVVATELTVRCALYDNTISYLTPIEQVGANLHLSELAQAFANQTDEAADIIARMREDASTIACGNANLEAYMDFARQVARDVIDVGMVAWRSIDVAECNYFVDEGFMAAAERARQAAETATIEGPQNRLDYINRRAESWVEVFADNCSNLGFDPVKTLPGAIALALPSERVSALSQAGNTI